MQRTRFQNMAAVLFYTMWKELERFNEADCTFCIERRVVQKTYA